eukprot:79133-Rhodomonas_salina.3
MPLLATGATTCTTTSRLATSICTAARRLCILLVLLHVAGNTLTRTRGTSPAKLVVPVGDVL